MSSKIAQQQQQGRRTPLSLSGAVGKGNNMNSVEQKTSVTSKDSAKKTEASNKQNSEKQVEKQVTMDLTTTKSDEQKIGQNGSSKAQKPTPKHSDAKEKKETEINGADEKRLEKTKQNEEAKLKASEAKKNGDKSNIAEKAEVKNNDKAVTKSPGSNAEKKCGAPNKTAVVAKSAEDRTADNGTDPISEKGRDTPKKMETSSVEKKTSPKMAILEKTTETAATVSSSPVNTTPKKNSQQATITENEPLTPMPKATSTPGRTRPSKRSYNKSADTLTVMETDVTESETSPLTKDRSNCPRTFSDISGRRSIRPLTEYSPSNFKTRKLGEYRGTHNESDVTNSSMNATVGSEVPNNASFSSFFSTIIGGNRKRERITPPHTAQQPMDIQMDTTPQKRARVDGFSSVFWSPMTLLRSRLSKSTIEPSMPNEMHAAEDVDDAHNVSGDEIVNDNDEAAEAENVLLGEEVNAEEQDKDGQKSEKTGKNEKETKKDRCTIM